METDSMSCPKGGEHNYQWVKGRCLCLKCERIASFQSVPSHATMLNQMKEIKVVIRSLIPLSDKIAKIWHIVEGN